MSILSSLRRVRVWLVLAAALCGVGALAAPIGFTGNYAQNFDSLADSGSSNAWANGQTLEGWYLFDRNKGDITTYLAGSGTGTGGGFYSFGSSASDRALGGLGSGGAYFGNAASGAVAGWIALAATNNSGSAIDRVTIRFNGEQWRNGGNTSAQPMTLEYGMGSSFAAVVTWTPAGADFNWASPVTGATAGAVDGNAAGRVADVGGTLTGLNWTAGQTLWLRWAEVNDNGNDHGLAIDDFSLTAATANADTALFTPNPGTTSGSSDASTAIALDADWMIVGDDEASVLRVYPRAGGAAVAEWSFDGVLGLRGEELDVEASTRIGNTLYFIGSHSNKRAGAEADSREHLFAVTTSGTGAATTFSFVGQYGGLEQALVSWDSGNAHGKGANHYGLAASSAGGVVPEAPNGFSIEGMAATASGQLLLGFRAPQASAATRTQALLVPLTNPQAVLTGSAPVFGVPIELNLGGRGVRSIERAGDGKFIIVAGPAGAVTTTAGSSHFALYVWDGTSPTATRLDNALDALLASTQGSFETVVAAPASTAPGTRVQLLQDNGDTLWPGKRVPSKSLPPAEQQFMGNWVTLGQPVAADTTPPALLSSVPAHNATGVGLRDAITLTFNEAVRRGTGRFELRQGATVVDTLAATDARVAFSGNTVTITPAARAANTAYTLVPVGQPVLDEAGNAWVGGSPLVFTTGAAPVAPTYSLLISEVNSNAPGEDFFELYNFGTTAIDLSGWRWIDDSGTFDHTAAGTFPAGSTLAPGATVVVLQKAPVDGFRSAWGLVASSPVWLVPGPGLGGGDAVLLYDADANLAAAVNYGTKTIAATGGLAVAPSLDSAGTAARGGHAGPAFAIGTPLPADGVSAVWDGQSTSAPRYTPAVVGTLGAFAQPGAAANIGSPGIPGVTVTPPGPSITRIHAIQGRGETSPLDGQRVTVQAVVTAHMPGLNGFFLQEQEADYDQDPLTSEGVFVFYGSATSANPNPNPGVSEATVGQRVRLTATVGAFRNQTQLAGSITDFSVLGAGAMPAPAVIQLPVSDMAVLEAHEGMRVEVRAASGGPLVVTDNYSLGRFGTVALSPDTPQVQFTEVNAPSGPGFSDFVQANRRAQIILDDGRSAQNPDPTRGRSGQSLSASNTLRVGDSVTSVVGVLDELYDTSAQPHQTSYRVQPTVTPVFTGAARPTADDFRQAVGPATVKVAAANVLNFFNIVGATSGSSQVMFTTPLGNRIGIRGANNADELKRQTDKIIAMLIGMDADVIGLMEIQNNGFGTSSALAVLTQALNASADKPAGAQFDYVKGPFTDGTRQDIAGAGDDAITVAFIYRADRVTPQGQAAVANTSAYPAFTAAGGHRVPLAQTFSVPVAGGGSAQFTVVANHFKSKGSLLPGAANADQFDGQGNNNAARVQAAQQLNDWLKNLPAGTVSPNVVLLGDFNAYAKEDPITTLEGHGWRKVSEGFSYQFRGLQGSLDHILVSPQLIGRVGHTVKWAINAEEPAVLDYNLEYKSPAQQASFYAPTAYSSSDHNPIVMGLNFGNQPPTLSGVPATARDVVAGQAFDLSGLAVADADGDRLTLTINATGVRVLGLADADAAQPGIQLQGTADELNALLAQAVLIADAAGNASVAFSLSDGVNPPVAATLVLQVAAVGAAHPANQFSVTPGGQGSAITGSVSGGGATCRVVPTPEAVTLAAAGASGLPRTGLAAPWGMLRLGTEGCDTGALVTVTLHFPADLPANAEYWKWGRTADNATARWYLLPATVNGRTVTFALRDGGLGDDDMQADGRITDPGGLFVPIATGGPGGTGPAAVPTLSQWALMLMALAMACLAGGRARRRG